MFGLVNICIVEKITKFDNDIFLVSEPPVRDSPGAPSACGWLALDRAVKNDKIDCFGEG